MKRHLVIPDCQVKPGVPLEHLSWLGEYILKIRPDVIVQIGDFADMESLCSYDKGKKSFEGRRYKKDIEVVQRGMKLLLEPLWNLQSEQRKQHKKVWEPRLVLTLGNHEDRIIRAVEEDAKLEGLIALSDLQYETWGWEVIPFLQPIIIDGVSYSHYFTSGQMGHAIGNARSILNKYHMSCFAGHQQGRDIAYSRRADGKWITAIICGSFYQHDEQYLNPITNTHWRGIYVLHEVENGSFDEMPVSIGYLKRKYGGKNAIH